MIKIKGLFLLLLLVFTSFIHLHSNANEEVLAFEGAVGFGKFSKGGSGGMVYIVDTLEDKNEPGSFRYGVNLKEPRIIRFSVSGIIKLHSPLKIKRDFITIEGQSSPRGIAIVGAPVSVRANQVIIRYLRFRLGTFGYAEDALTVRNSKQVIIDHCSLSWSVDETGSFYGNSNFTLQHSIIANSLNKSIHPKGEHGYGGIWGGNNASFINNIIANHKSRTPRLNGHRLSSPYPQEKEYVEVINNVIYNWGSNNIYGSENGKFSLINNYYQPGPDSKAKRFIDIFPSTPPLPKQAFILGNYYHTKNWQENNLLGVVFRDKDKNKTQPSKNDPRLALSPKKLSTKMPVSQLDSAQMAYRNLVIEQNVGANLTANGPFLDSVDLQVLNQIVEAKNSMPNQGIINHEFEQIKSWQEYALEFSKTKSK